MYISGIKFLALQVLTMVVFVGALAYSYAYYGRGYGGIFLDNVACSGIETMLMDCISRSHIGVHNCQHDDDAGVRCQGNERIVVFQTLYFCT